MDKEDKICGMELLKIRNAYFKGKISKLLIDIQAVAEYSESEYEKLKLFLASLQKKDELLNDNFSQFLPKIEAHQADTVLDELNKEKLSEVELAELSREKSNRVAAVAMVARIIKGLFFKFHNPKEKTPNQEELMDAAFEVLSLQWYILRDSLYKERLFRKKIVEFEHTGRQRKLAEELAKTTVEYRDYALAEGLKEISGEFMNLAKKRYKDI